MKSKIYCFFLLTLNCLISHGQNMGIGVVTVLPSEETIHLSIEQNKADSIWIDWNSGDSGESIFQTSYSEGIEALEEYVTPASLFFRCLKTTEDSLQVIINESSNQSAWIKKEKSVTLDDWLTFLSSTDYIQIDNTYHNLIRIAPTDSASVLPYSSCGRYKIIQIKGDWIEIEEFDCEHPVKGWIKWNNGKKLVVVRMRYE